VLLWPISLDVQTDWLHMQQVIICLWKPGGGPVLTSALKQTELQIVRKIAKDLHKSIYYLEVYTGHLLACLS